MSFIQLQLIFQEWADKASKEFGTSLFQKELAEWVNADSDSDQAFTLNRYNDKCKRNNINYNCHLKFFLLHIYIVAPTSVGGHPSTTPHRGVDKVQIKSLIFPRY